MSYIVNCVVDEVFFGLWKSPMMYRIVSDFEEISSFQVCRYLIQESLAMAYPIMKTPYFFVTNALNGKILDCISSNLRLQVRYADDLPEWGKVSFVPQQAIVFILTHYLMNGPFQLLSLHPDENMRVMTSVLQEDDDLTTSQRCTVEIENCLLCSDGTCTAYIKIHSTRLKIFSKLLMMSEAEGLKNSEGILVSTGDDVTILGHHELSLLYHAKSAQAVLLTDANRRELQQGYRAFLPTNAPQFFDYWRLTAGWQQLGNLPKIDLLEISDGVHNRIVPADLVTRFLVTGSLSKQLQQIVMDMVMKGFEDTNVFSQVKEPTAMKPPPAPSTTRSMFQKASALLSQQRKDLDAIGTSVSPLPVAAAVVVPPNVLISASVEKNVLQNNLSKIIGAKRKRNTSKKDNEPSRKITKVLVEKLEKQALAVVPGHGAVKEIQAKTVLGDLEDDIFAEADF